MLGLQRALSLIFPDQCLLCPELVESNGGLCASCWRDMPFIRGAVCDACGAPLPGSDVEPGDHCDDCLSLTRPWSRGRAALSYRDAGRRLVLLLKHADRPDLAGPAAAWLEKSGKSALLPDTLLVPVPIHRARLLSRRYNQSAELCRALARRTGLPYCGDALIRTRRTVIQDGLGVDARFTNVAGAIRFNPRRQELLAGRRVCIVDDVMTSGATLAACAEACRQAQSGEVFVLALARVTKDH